MIKIDCRYYFFTIVRACLLPATSASVVIIVKHLWGNMLSRWKNFLSADRETEWQDRDAELTAGIQSGKELLDKWNEGWSCLFNSISALTKNDLMRKVYIRRQEHTVTEAIDIQLTHYSYYIGQIVFLRKMISDHAASAPGNDSQKNNTGKILTAQTEVHSVEEYFRESRNKFDTTK